jgi:lipoprotein-anchoring transpeptidase ErfK/SrfK
MERIRRVVMSAIIAVSAAACAHAAAASLPAQEPWEVRAPVVDTAALAATRARMDSVERALVWTAAAPRFLLTARNVRLEVSVARRQLLVIAGADTLRRAPVAVASGRTFRYAGRQWRFATPRGRHTVQGKRTDPTWRPPDWHYAEIAKRHGLTLRRLVSGTRLADGARLVIRDSVVGVLRPNDTTFLALPTDEHIVFDATLFIPPLTTLNRYLHHELGAYALDLGDGYMLHGTWDQRSIGSDTTHGCIRLADADLAWLYAYVPVGVSVVVR